MNTQRSAGPPTPEVRFCGQSLAGPVTGTMTVQQFPEANSESEASPAYWAELQLMNAAADPNQGLRIRTPSRGQFSTAERDGTELKKPLQKELSLR